MFNCYEKNKNESSIGEKNIENYTICILQKNLKDLIFYGYIGEIYILADI